MSDFDEIRQRIYQRRKYLGLTLQELADLSNSSKSYIWELEKGAKKPSINKIIDVAAGLRCSVGYLVGERDLDEKLELTHKATQLRDALNKFIGDEL